MYIKRRSSEPMLAIDGSVRIKVEKITRSLLADFTILNTRPIRKIRNSVIITRTFVLINMVKTSSIIDTTTIQKSNLFHLSPKYKHLYAVILIAASTQNIIVKVRFSPSSTAWSSESCPYHFNASIKLLITIHTRMNISNLKDSAILKKNSRNLLFYGGGFRTISSAFSM
jgi:hypothetical protein